ncbi:ABC transporter permease [Bordetella pertussis]|nr:ABC transporter permease [Bordetella pertussis]
MAIVGQSAAMAGVVPTPVQVARAWYAWIFGDPGMGLNPYQGTWVSNVQYSTMRVAQGFALAMATGIPLGLAIGWSRLTSQLLDPLIQGLRPIPITAWLPFSIALFGIRDMGSIFLIFLGGFYAIVVNTTQGARDVDRNLVRAASMMGASSGQLMRRVVLPAAMPSIFTGLRIGLGISWTAVIVSEMVAVKSGLGYVLWDAYYVGPHGHRAGQHGVHRHDGLSERPAHRCHRAPRPGVAHAAKPLRPPCRTSPLRN